MVVGPKRRPSRSSTGRQASAIAAAVDACPAAHRFAAEIDVLGDRQVRRQRQLLVDDGDAGALGGDRVADLHRLAVDQDLAARRRRW